MRKKAQAALEFLMTYGWAILLVIVVVGALYATGMLKPCRWTGLQAKEFPLSEVRVDPIRLAWNGSHTELVFNVYYQKPQTANLTRVIVNGTVEGTTLSGTELTDLYRKFETNSPATITLSISKQGENFSGKCADLEVKIYYKVGDETEERVASGRITGPVS